MKVFSTKFEIYSKMMINTTYMYPNSKDKLGSGPFPEFLISGGGGQPT